MRTRRARNRMSHVSAGSKSRLANLVNPGATEIADIPSVDSTLSQGKTHDQAQETSYL